MEGSKSVLLVGTLDTKGAEYAYLRERLRAHGVDAILADAGVNEPVGVTPDISRHDLAAETGADPDALAAAGDRGAAVTAMAEASEALARRLYGEGRIGGVLAAGGSGGTAIATRAMRALPVGAPKLMVSTMAAGNTADYVGAERRHDDGVGHRRRGRELDLRPDHGQRRRGDGGHDPGAAGRAGRGATADRREHVRRHHAERDARARAARGARLRGPDVPRHRRRRARDGGADGVRLPRRACSTSRRPSCATSWSAACCPPARTGSRRPAGSASRRSCPWARSTWSTSARARRCRRSSRTATCTCTTRRSR